MSTSDPFVGEIRMFAGNRIPDGWLPCDGQRRSISQYIELFMICGTNYGGDGITTFGVPFLWDSAVLMAGQGPGLSFYEIGETGGVTAFTLTEKEMPVHTHLPAVTNLGTAGEPDNNTWANAGTVRPGPVFYASTLDNPVLMSDKALTDIGGGAAHNNMMPYTVLVFCIAWQGYFPPRE